MFSFWTFISLTFKFIDNIHFEILDNTTYGSMFTFYIQMSSCSRNIHWKNYPFSIELSWFFCWKSVGHICMNLFLDSIFPHLSILMTYQTLFFTVALQQVSKDDTVSHPASFSFSSLFLHKNCKSATQCLWKSLLGILISSILNLQINLEKCDTLILIFAVHKHAYLPFI